jgi:hypothetical protein
MKFDVGDPHLFLMNHMSIVIQSAQASTQLWVIWSVDMQPFLEEPFHITFGHIHFVSVSVKGSINLTK